MYLCAAREAISAVLLTEKDSRKIPIYFVSRALQAPEINYNSMEKVALALVHATRRLRRYFQAHSVAVVTDQPIKQILSRSENTRRMLKWKFKLEAFDITYRSRTSIRGQVLADFIAKKPDEGGSSMKFTYVLRFEFDISNNEAEYEALVAGLRIAEQIGEKDILAKVEEEEYCWMTPLVEYLTEGTLPAETKKARAIKIKARQYTMINGVLYRMSFLEPWLRCFGPTQAKYVVKEIHEGSYNMHSGPRACNDCQTHRPVPRNPQQKLTPITSPWPFHKWGIDISGPFPKGQWKVKFLIIAIDYFTKWIEAKPCEKLNIKQRFASVKHPQTNGQVERANRSLGEGIKARLGEDNRNWVEEVAHVLWAHRTMIKTSNGDTSVSLTYGTEAVIPVEIGMPSIRCAKVNQVENDKELLLNLDILEERREKAAVRKARNKAIMAKYYNAKVRSTSFRPGDFVYRSNKASRAKESGKLGPKWEGPYKVVKALGKGAYKLRNGSRDILSRTWNVQDLKNVIFKFLSCKYPRQCKTALAVGVIFI
ncbi:reverse transcriptase domain-containing protein [Tanacetum coccineum]